MTPYNAEGSYPNNYAGGINGEFGYMYWVENIEGTDLHEVVFWHYNNGSTSDDYPQGDYNVIVWQEFDDGSSLWFSQDISIYNLSGASQLVAASMAAATAIFALI